MAVIREDVVSIGFEVQNNPFGELTAGINEIKAKLGILDETGNGLSDVGREAQGARREIENLVDDIHGPPTDELSEPLREAGNAANEAGDDIDDLIDDMQDVGRQRLTDGIRALTEGLRNPKQGFQDLLGKAKQFAKEKLDTMVSRLPPKLQLGIKAGGALLGALGKVAKLSMNTVVSGVKSLAAYGAKAANGLKALGKGAAVGILSASVAVGGLGAASIKVGAGFEASMSQVAATMGMTADEADYSNETYAKLANTAKEMGASTKFSASESAEALNYMALAGYDADKSCAALPTVLNLAASGGMELAAASDMVTDSMSALGIEATTEKLTQFGDQLAKTAQKSNTSVAQLGEAVLTVGGTAKNLAGGTTELNTLLGIIADNGVKGAEGGTALRNIMLSLQAPTDIAAKKMKSLGLSVYDTEGKMRPMNDILGDLNSSMDGMTDQQKQDAISTIFNKNDLKSVNALLAGMEVTTSQLSKSLAETGFDTTSMSVSLDDLAKDFNKTQDESEFIAKSMQEFGMSSEQAKVLFDGLTSVVDGKATRFNELSGYVSNSAGAMENMAETMNDNLTGRVTEFKSAMEGAGIAVFEALGSSNLKGLVQEASGWVTELTKATEEGGIDGLVSQVGTTLSKVLVTITGYAPQLVQAGISVINSLVSGLVQNREQISTSVVSGITTLLTGIIQMAPQLLSAGLLMLSSFLSGMDQQMPNILSAGLIAIQNLCSGLIQNAPAIIQSGINLVLQLMNGLIAAAPTILMTGIQLVIMLAQGLIAAIPDLISMIPQIVSAIITTLMSVDWLKLGLDIIKGVGDGLVKGIKGLFSKGKDAGKEVGDGITAGLNESTAEITTAANDSSQAATEAIEPNTVKLSDYGVQMTDSFAGGITSGSSAVSTAAAYTSNAALTGFETSLDTTQFGAIAVDNMAQGIQANTSMVTSAAAELGNQATEAVQLDGLTEVPEVFNHSFAEANIAVGTNLSEMGVKIDAAFKDMLGNVNDFAGAFRDIIASIKLYSTGVNIMDGLKRGMKSMEGSLMATAKGIASGISGTINSTLDIHSPSRVTEESGKFTGLGLVKGLQGTSKEVRNTAKDVSDTTARTLSPMQNRYSPDFSSMKSAQNTRSEVNHYSPTFNLTLNGASASDSNERKVKRWVKDAMNEFADSMGRSHARVQEV